MSDESRFDSWTDCKIVDCNDCGHWWDNSCDGVPEDSEKLCTSFLATRKVVIPLKIKALEKAVKSLRWSLSLVSIALALHILEHMFGG